mgnify:CR=1 FL=1|jgi:hypothetical protein
MSLSLLSTLLSVFVRYLLANRHAIRTGKFLFRFPFRFLCSRTAMALPSSRVTPLNTCPEHRPRWYPENRHDLFLQFYFLDFCFPAHAHCQLSSIKCFDLSLLPVRPQIYNFRGSITQPVFSLHSASHNLITRDACEFTTGCPAKA